MKYLCLLSLILFGPKCLVSLLLPLPKYGDLPHLLLLKYGALLYFSNIVLSYYFSHMVLSPPPTSEKWCSPPPPTSEIFEVGGEHHIWCSPPTSEIWSYSKFRKIVLSSLILYMTKVTLKMRNYNTIKIIIQVVN